MSAQSMQVSREEVRARLDALEAGIDRLLGDSSSLAAQVRELRAAFQALSHAEEAERHRLAHDLRAPLNAIAGWTQVLRLEKDADKNVLHAADVFERNVRAMAKLLDGFTG
jgi:signal transduction histidine kinase